MQSIPTYFIVVSLAFSICLVWLARRTDAQGLSRNQALDISLILMITGFIGARFVHIFFEEPFYYAEDLARVFEIWRGGFVWYGGALISGMAALIFMRRRKLDLGRWLDLFAPVLALGYMLGRVACWIVGCCYGDFCHLFEGMTFRYPTQAFAVFWEGGVLALLLYLERARRRTRAPFWLQRYPGRLFSLWLMLHAIGRIIMEIFRADPRGPAPLGLSISTWISLALIAAVLSVETRRSR